MRGNYKSFDGTYRTVVKGMRQFTMYILSVVQPVRKGRSGPKGQGGVVQQISVAYIHNIVYIHIGSAGPVAYQTILEPGICQFREFEYPLVHTRMHSWVLSLYTN